MGNADVTYLKDKIKYSRDMILLVKAFMCCVCEYANSE